MVKNSMVINDIMTLMMCKMAISGSYTLVDELESL